MAEPEKQAVRMASEATGFLILIGLEIPTKHLKKTKNYRYIPNTVDRATLDPLLILAI
uniref:hypothetical protein n=1 Tax=uncultured Halomonas sp. TaxID=173971 RepID=UPI0026197A44|nr:hypothetical protein [uncultured Halomonas sp.]